MRCITFVQTLLKARGYKGRPARIEREYSFTLTVTVNQEALEASIQRLGWRVLATNAPVSILSSEQAVLAYRNNVPIEVNNFRRLKNKPLSLHPMYVQRSDHAIGLVRLLSLCLRTLVLLDLKQAYNFPQYSINELDLDRT